MRSYFQSLASAVFKKIHQDEILLLNLKGEMSDFCRFNKNAVRQLGSVDIKKIDIHLISQNRQVFQELELTSDFEYDLQKILQSLEQQRKMLPLLPEDQFILYSQKVENSVVEDVNILPDSAKMIEQIIKHGEGLDLVGILAVGSIFYGFANSLGQMNWYQKYNFNFDWSVYLHTDKAIKTSYAGIEWDEAILVEKIQSVKKQLEILKRPIKKIQPGKYNAYLTPTALGELIGLLNWGAFSEKAAQTKSSPLQKLLEGSETFNSQINLIESRKEGMSPNFDSFGFKLSDEVVLIENGKIKNHLISPRTAKEYKLIQNSGQESAESLTLQAGRLNEKEILKLIGTGLYVNNLWYTNYSDRVACRMTGMTRFACFWVENGEIVAPINVMRFDESIYNILNHNLIGITENVEYSMDASTYGGRSTTTSRFPGVVVKDMNFTL